MKYSREYKYPGSVLRWYTHFRSGDKVSRLDLDSGCLITTHHIKNKCTEALNLIRIVTQASWGTDQDTLLLPLLLICFET